MPIFFLRGILSILVANLLSLLSSVFDPIIYLPYMPYNSSAEAENELMEMLVYDTAVRALRSNSSTGLVPNISEFDHLKHVL